MASHSNIQGARVSDCLLMQGNRLGLFKQTLAADNMAIDADMGPVLVLDAGGGAKDILLPAASAALRGYWFLIINDSDAAETITVKDSADTLTIATLDGHASNKQLCESAIIVCDGTLWRALTGTGVVTTP